MSVKGKPQRMVRQKGAKANRERARILEAFEAFNLCAAPTRACIVTGSVRRVVGDRPNA